jgi:nicotinamide riboside transporter PnuC
MILMMKYNIIIYYGYYDDYLLLQLVFHLCFLISGWFTTYWLGNAENNKRSEVVLLLVLFVAGGCVCCGLEFLICIVGSIMCFRHITSSLLATRDSRACETDNISSTACWCFTEIRNSGQ